MKLSRKISVEKNSWHFSPITKKQKKSFKQAYSFRLHNTTTNDSHIENRTEQPVRRQTQEDRKQEILAKLMRRAKAYNSSCSQVILVYLHPFRRNSLFCSQKSPKKSRLINIFRVQGHSRLSMLTFIRSSSSVLVMISSMAVPICNHLHARQANRV